MNMSENSS